jgi:hypothetical protein
MLSCSPKNLLQNVSLHKKFRVGDKQKEKEFAMDKKIVDYYVVAQESAPNLIRDCNTLVRQGWQPYGGISCSRLKSSSRDGLDKAVYAQAMVKYEK